LATFWVRQSRWLDPDVRLLQVLLTSFKTA
jgi:hypothetical protein